MDKETMEFLKSFKQSIDGIQESVKDLQDNMSVMQNNMSVMQNDINVMKNDMNVMKDDIDVMKDDINVINGRLDNLEEGQQRIEKKLDSVYEQTADLTEFRTEVNEKIDNISSEFITIEMVSGKNLRDIAELKKVK